MFTLQAHDDDTLDHFGMLDVSGSRSSLTLAQLAMIPDGNTGQTPPVIRPFNERHLSLSGALSWLARVSFSQ